MQRNKLTDAKIRGAKPGPKPRKVSDGGGLFLHVLPNGSRLWRWRFWLEGKEQSYAVGSYPDTALADARKASDIARELVKRGINPAHVRQDERQRNIEESDARRREAEGAFAKVSAAWLGAGKLEWSPGTYEAKKKRVERHLLPALGSIPITRIGAKEIRPLLVRSEAGGGWAPVYVKSDLNGIFGYALARGLCDSNPVPGLRGLIRFPKSEGKAVLSLPQIRTFFAKLKAQRGHPETAMCLRFIALNACRPGEAANAEWSEIDLDANLWRRAAEKMKARREHQFPLSSQALALLEEIRFVSGGRRYLFPHRTQGDGCATTSRLSNVMLKLELGSGASPHCWRSTFSTWANERGFRPDAIERQLAHVEMNKVRATYNRALLVDERRTMMQAWADYLSAAEAENVIQLRPVG